VSIRIEKHANPNNFEYRKVHMERKLFTISEVRALTGIGRDTLYSLAQRGRVKAFRVGRGRGRWLYTQEAIDDLNAGTVDFS
jgi:excisionase family DNA binding protein